MSLRTSSATTEARDDADVQLQQLSANGVARDSVALFPYGLSASPPVGSIAALFSVMADPANRVHIPTATGAARFKGLEPGEVVVYHPITQTRLHFKANGDIEVQTGSASELHTVESLLVDAGNVIVLSADTGVVVTCPDISLNGDVVISGDLDVTGDTTLADLEATGSTTLGATVTSNGKDISDTHTHIGSLTAGTGGQSPTGKPN